MSLPDSLNKLRVYCPDSQKPCYVVSTDSASTLYNKTLSFPIIANLKQSSNGGTIKMPPVASGETKTLATIDDIPSTTTQNGSLCSLYAIYINQDVFNNTYCTYELPQSWTHSTDSKLGIEEIQTEGRQNEYISIFSLKCWTSTLLSGGSSYILSEALTLPNSDYEPIFVGPAYYYSNDYIPRHCGHIMIKANGLELIILSTVQAILEGTCLTCCSTFHSTDYNIAVNGTLPKPEMENFGLWSTSI